MPKIFVALDLPAELTRQLTALQPPPAPGIRLVEPDQMHLTLHFIGEVEQTLADRMAAVLQTVAVPAFSVVVEGVGEFPSTDGATTLWAGIRENAGLRQLHSAIGQALEHVGFQPEARPYTPHLTLARCASPVPREVVSGFLTQHQDVSLTRVPITHFSLWSSVWQSGVPVYRREREYLLRPALVPIPLA